MVRGKPGCVRAAKTRKSNYAASLRLEGFHIPPQTLDACCLRVKRY